MSFEYEMIFEHAIFKERPPNNSIRRLNFTAVNNRLQYLSWCKARAFAVLATGDTRAAISSMLSDLAQWKGGKIYEAGELEMRRVEATLYTNSAEEIRDWIEDFT